MELRRPFRLLVVPPPAAVHVDPWAGVLEVAASTPGVQAAVVGTAAVALPAGVIAHELRPLPLPSAVAAAVGPWPPEALAWARGAARALGSLVAGGWVPDVAVVDAGSGVGLLLADVLPALRLVVRVGGPRVAPTAAADGRDPLVVSDFTLAGAHAVVCPHAGVRATLPPPFGTVALTVADGVDLDLFRPAETTATPRPPVVVDLGTAPEDLDRLRRVVDRLAARHPDLRLAHGLGALPAPDRARLLAEATVCVSLGESGSRLDEAFAVGGVVVAAGDLRGWDTVRHGRDGFLVDVESDGALRDALAYTLAMAGGLRDLRRAARRRAETTCERLAVGRRLLAIAVETAGAHLPGVTLPAEELPPRS